MKRRSVTVVGGLSIVTMVAAIASCEIMTRSANAAIIDYSADLAADFTATYPGGDPGSAVPPTANPFGDWALRGPDGTTASLVPSSSLDASGQVGWNGVPSAGGPYTYFAAQWQPGVTINPRIEGHVFHNVLWTAPANVDAGGIAISGSLEQVFEPSRVLRLSIFKNGGATADFTVDFKPPIVNGVLLRRVNFGPLNIPVVPGDTLKFFVDGSGTGGTGVVTFGAWDVNLREIELVPEPASLSLFGAGLLALVAIRRRQK